MQRGDGVRAFQRLLAFSVLFSPLAWAQWRDGDCVVYREGGEGRLLTSPTYWLKGTVSGIDPGKAGGAAVRVVIEAWETQWSIQHGRRGRLFRGRFSDRDLKKGESVEIGVSLLESCDEGV